MVLIKLFVNGCSKYLYLINNINVRGIEVESFGKLVTICTVFLSSQKIGPTAIYSSFCYVSLYGCVSVPICLPSPQPVTLKYSWMETSDPLQTCRDIPTECGLLVNWGVVTAAEVSLCSLLFNSSSLVLSLSWTFYKWDFFLQWHMKHQYRSSVSAQLITTFFKSMVDLVGLDHHIFQVEGRKIT